MSIDAWRFSIDDVSRDRLPLSRHVAGGGRPRPPPCGRRRPPLRSRRFSSPASDARSGTIRLRGQAATPSRPETDCTTLPRPEARPTSGTAVNDGLERGVALPPDAHDGSHGASYPPRSSREPRRHGPRRDEDPRERAQGRRRGPTPAKDRRPRTDPAEAQADRSGERLRRHPPCASRVRSEICRAVPRHRAFGVSSRRSSSRNRGCAQDPTDPAAPERTRHVRVGRASQPKRRRT